MAKPQPGTDPYAPVGTLPTYEPQTEPLLEQFVRRLWQLGATPDEVQAVRDSWDELDDEWTAEARFAFANSTDEALLAAIAEGRRELDDGLHTDDEQEARRRTELEAAVLADAQLQVNQSVDAALAWVKAANGDDELHELRARALLQLEREGLERKTLLEPLAKQVEAFDAAGGGDDQPPPDAAPGG
jgi:hypothetical protein